MKFLKVMLAVLTCLAVTLTGVLLFVDKHGPRYIQIDNSPILGGHVPAHVGQHGPVAADGFSFFRNIFVTKNLESSLYS